MKPLLALIAALALVGSARAQNFPDILVNHWAYKATLNLLECGLGRNVWQGIRGNRPATRYEMAVFCHDAATNLDARLDTMIREAKGRGKSVAVSDDLLVTLGKMCDLFQKELQSMEVDLDLLRRQIEAARPKAAILRDLAAGKQPKFPDVPANHWAARAVEDLHSLGLLIGYPDGKFRG